MTKLSYCKYHCNNLYICFKKLINKSTGSTENEAVYALVDERNKPQPSNGNKKLEEIDTIYANVNVADKKETEKLSN